MKDYHSDRTDNVDFNTTATGHGVITAMFPNQESAEKAFAALENRGYTQNEINIVMSDKTREGYLTEQRGRDTKETGNKAIEGLGTGSAIGGTIGAIAGAIAAIGTSLIIPGLGLVIAGPIAAALAGAGAGGFTGGLVGALIGAGIPEHDVKRYEEGLKKGNVVLAVHPHSEEDVEYIEKVWRSNNGEVASHHYQDFRKGY